MEKPPVKAEGQCCVCPKPKKVENRKKLPNRVETTLEASTWGPHIMKWTKLRWRRRKRRKKTEKKMKNQKRISNIATPTNVGTTTAEEEEKAQDGGGVE
ncbi:hypothetical protein RUM43_008507 [Polyplax serrata]|uniref:Uncharacterized protein n=1 Tax=Polyplax serrata TaxID=468196 RepID=A0AAN8NTQ3_POLSC